MFKFTTPKKFELTPSKLQASPSVTVHKRLSEKFEIEDINEKIKSIDSVIRSLEERL